MAQTDSQNCVLGRTLHGSVPCSEGAVLKLAGPAMGRAMGCGGGCFTNGGTQDLGLL